MKAELRNLLDRLRSEQEGFQNIMIFPNGTSRATFRHGCQTYSIEELESFAYPASGPTNPVNPEILSK